MNEVHYATLTTLVIAAAVFWCGYRIGYIWGTDSQRIKDLEQFIKTGRLEYDWRANDQD